MLHPQGGGKKKKNTAACVDYDDDTVLHSMDFL